MTANGSQNSNDQPAAQERLIKRWRGWRRNHPWLGWLLSVAMLLLLAYVLGNILGGLIQLAYHALNAPEAPAWTGFGPTQYPLYSGYLPPKNFWDWLGLLLIPLFLAVGAALLNRAQQSRELRERDFDRQQAEAAQENEWAIERDRQEQEVLDRYMNQMTDLLLEYGLRRSGADDDTRYIARATTLAILRHVNAERKALVLHFLYEARLINTPEPIVRLEGADLSGVSLGSADLRKAHLAGTNLHEAELGGSNLDGADLSGVDLIGADLRKSRLNEADLSESFLSNAHLRSASLKKADLTAVLLNNANAAEADFSRATLTAANLVGADFSRANLQGADLSEAKCAPSKAESNESNTLTVDQATYDAATAWPDGYDPVANGAIDVSADS